MCFERIAAAGPGSVGAARCGSPGCRGWSAVCAACAALVDKCVYCRAPRAGFAPGADAETVLLRMYTALYYASLVSYVMGQVDLAPGSDPDSDSESEPEYSWEVDAAFAPAPVRS